MTDGSESDAETIAPEPSLLPRSRRLRRRFATRDLVLGYLRYLEARIRRDRRDLQAHVERVLLRDELADATGLYAALVDLSIAVAPVGRDLRRGLLARTGGRLTPGQRAGLHAHLDAPLEPGSPLAAVPGACLSLPITGTTLIVRRRGVAPLPDGSPGALARRALAAGDEVVAQELLEGAVELDPGRADLCLELLALYRRAGRRGDFERTRTRLLGRRVACAEEWRRTEAYFANATRGSGA